MAHFLKKNHTSVLWSSFQRSLFQEIIETFQVYGTT